MIENTFCHIKGIGLKFEKQLWDLKIYDWKSFSSAEDIPISKKKLAAIREALEKSNEALHCHHHRYFSDGLPSNQHWRLFRYLNARTAYLDIETTGLSSSYDKITTIALYDGKNIKYYVNGFNLEKFKTDIQHYDLLVTYNGKCFDIPFIEDYFKIKLTHSHIDLRYVLYSLGYKGGLKGCEKQFGLSRNELEDIDGYFAVLLWREFEKTKNKRALDTLLAYNIEDAVNLEYLMYSAYNIKIKETPFESILHLDIPCKPSNPFSPDIKLVNTIKEKIFYSNIFSF